MRREMGGADRAWAYIKEMVDGGVERNKTLSRQR